LNSSATMATLQARKSALRVLAFEPHVRSPQRPPFIGISKLSSAPSLSCRSPASKPRAPVVMSASMNAVESFAAQATGATHAVVVEEIQALWAGYGSIARVSLDDSSTAIVKHVNPPNSHSTRSHPRGWTGDLSHARKVKSYAVETRFYTHFAAKCRPECRVPALLAVKGGEDGGDGRSGERFLLLEDLDAAGWPERRSHMDRTEVDACLRWLAWFHASFLGCQPTGLWAVGTYWHLHTRPDELDAMPPRWRRLKDAARAIDTRLSSCRYRTIVHGDAKVCIL
jgi:hypothetical protein